ncbi:cytochrome P450 [Xylariomycetidae sp. FL2044]|nr:cytochrome P450 [Xylariomycetidae sp. FL2044]
MAGTYNIATRALGHAQDHPWLFISILTFATITYRLIYLPLISSPLRAVPGPKAFAATKWRLAYADYRGTRTRVIHALHEKYGPVVRIAPDEVSFASLAALRTIYGAGSGFERTEFYRMFDVYGRQNLFTFAGVREHGERKKLLAHAYAKSAVLSPTGVAKPLIERNVRSFLDLIEKDADSAREIFTSLHWFSLDSITGFLYGDRHGGTGALRGDEPSRALLHDILDPHRRLLSWFAVHLKTYTAWLYTRTGVMESVVARLGLLPMAKPATYTGIRAHALAAWKSHESSPIHKSSADQQGEPIITKLQRHQETGKGKPMDGLDIASEAADHFLAGIDTTADTLMFLMWQLSRPENWEYQQKLQEEVDAIPADALDSSGNPTAEVADRLPYLDALIKETLRLHAPLPASEPRSLGTDTTVDGYAIPAGTVVSMAPYTLHRNPEVFADPLRFRPERWLGEYGDLAEMKKWFWAFSSGGRTCIGMHLAMAEMTTFMATVYRKYSTSLQDRQKGISPGITSRFEVFYDETFEEMEEHKCWVNFTRREP